MRETVMVCTRGTRRLAWAGLSVGGFSGGLLLLRPGTGLAKIPHALGKSPPAHAVSRIMKGEGPRSYIRLGWGIMDEEKPRTSLSEGPGPRRQDAMELATHLEPTTQPPDWPSVFSASPAKRPTFCPGSARLSRVGEQQCPPRLRRELPKIRLSDFYPPSPQNAFSARTQLQTRAYLGIGGFGACRPSGWEKRKASISFSSILAGRA